MYLNDKVSAGGGYKAAMFTRTGFGCVNMNNETSCYVEKDFIQS